VVTDFAEAAGLKIVETDAARRLVQVSGTVAQLSKAFSVELALYRSAKESYRGREGAIHLPNADVVEGVFGLDNRRMARRMRSPMDRTPDTLRAHCRPAPRSRSRYRRRPPKPLSEDTWNDNQVTPQGAGGGATGGGVSYLAGVATWQANANVPVSVNSDHHQGRGLPDVAGNASPNSGYDLWLYGKALSQLVITSGPVAGNPFGVVGGTSAVAPLYAALIALINASLNKRVGYLNHALWAGFRRCLSGY
jgi:subtilase family serine protease